MVVLVIGTLDTKGEELAFLRARLQQAGPRGRSAAARVRRLSQPRRR
jgi:uncharacterized protein (UPF0261 family)